MCRPTGFQYKHTQDGMLVYCGLTVHRIMTLMNMRSNLVAVLCVGRGPSAWGVVNHLLGVKNSEDLRQAHQTVQPQVVEMMTAVGE